ncbi:MAG TPA: hypothetical protein VK203_11705 [Nostocaceae cyanobacterium]|nr:hypothetical protein [Nostocaceae cyanobacterium]
MTRKTLHQNEVGKEAWYSVAWQKLKLFPGSLAAGSQNPPKVSGPAAAALISAGIGCLTMMIVQHFTAISKDIDNIIWMLGSWIPGSRNANKVYGEIGSYSGKETMLLIGWLVNWIILHLAWRNTNVKTRTIFFWMFFLFIAATAMSWHPLFSYLPLM